MDFLKEMEALGLGKKYSPTIHQEIAEKIRMIDAMDGTKSAEVEKQLEGLKYKRPPPKPFPLGELQKWFQNWKFTNVIIPYEVNKKMIIIPFQDVKFTKLYFKKYYGNWIQDVKKSFLKTILKPDEITTILLQLYHKIAEVYPNRR